LTTYRDFEVFGGVREFVNYRGPEAIVHGPAETGKTIGALYKLHICADTYPNASIVIARKTLSSTYSTVLQTFQNKVLRDLPGVDPYGGSKPEWFDYPNGSRIWMAGLDKSSKILSAEHDVIYVNQAEELTLDDWETLTTRTTGRAGNMPYSQTIGDANPAWPLHWMYHRRSLRLFYSYHRENPALYDPETGEITEQGRLTMIVLEALTGLRRTRLLDGKPAQAEGVIYEGWNPAIHLLYSAPPLSRHIASQDWGYVNPGALGVWGIDGDDNMFLRAQIYRTRKNIDWWTERALELQREFGKFEAVACDPSRPEYIEEYRQAGLNAVAAGNQVLPGIDKVQQRLAALRLFIVRDCSRYIDSGLKAEHKPCRTEDEFPSYIWASTTKEQPVKEDDHGMDMVRYAVMYLDAERKPPPAGEQVDVQMHKRRRPSRWQRG
jgi:phage terminase large subunit